MKFELLALLLIGCASCSTTSKFTNMPLNTSKQDVLSVLGPPQDRSEIEGREIWMYRAENLELCPAVFYEEKLETRIQCHPTRESQEMARIESERWMQISAGLNSFGQQLQMQRMELDHAREKRQLQNQIKQMEYDNRAKQIQEQNSRSNILMPNPR